MRTRTLVRSTAAASTALTAALALTSCSSLAGVDQQEWSDAKQMSASPQSDSVPTLVASDATSIKLQTPSYGKGNTYLSWDSEQGVTREDCTAGAIGEAPDTEQPNWWPTSAPVNGQRCGWWRVFTADGNYYAWQMLPNQS